MLCFDGDEAGARAAARAVERALPQLSAKRSLRFATLPTGQDPDTMVRDRGRRAMAEIVAAAIPLSDQLWKMAAGGRALETPEARARVNKQLQDQVARIPRPRPRFSIYGGLSATPAAAVAGAAAGRRAIVRCPRAASAAWRGARRRRARHRAAPRARLAPDTAQLPALALEQQEAVAGLHLETPRFAAVTAALIDWPSLGPSPEGAELRATLADQGLDGVVEELVGQDAQFLDRPTGIDHARDLFVDALKRQHQRLEEQATRAEAEAAHTDEEAWEQTRERILRLQETAKAETDIPDLGATPRQAGRSDTRGSIDLAMPPVKVRLTPARGFFRLVGVGEA